MKVEIQNKKGLTTILSIIIDKTVVKPFLFCISIFILILGGQEETRTLKPFGTSS